MAIQYSNSDRRSDGKRIWTYMFPVGRLKFVSTLKPHLPICSRMPLIAGLHLFRHSEGRFNIAFLMEFLLSYVHLFSTLNT